MDRGPKAQKQQQSEDLKKKWHAKAKVFVITGM